MFKKIVSTILGVAIIGSSGCGIAAEEQKPVGNLYPKTAVVVELCETEDLVIVADANGQHWCFSGMEDWCIGDLASMLMDDVGTEIIYDDEIVDTYYSGYVAADIEQ